jgi:hypothetical protein
MQEKSVFGWLKRKRLGGGDTSIGMQAVQKIAETWMVDSDRVEWIENGFNWWPGSFRVEVRCFDGPTPELKDRWRVSVTTDFVNDLTVDRKVGGLLAGMARLWQTYSVVYPPAAVSEAQGRGGAVDIYCFSSAYIDSTLLNWLAQFLAAMAILQPINTEIQAEFQADLLGGKAAYWRGRKESELDEMLDVVRTLYVPAGEAPSWWSNTSEFEELASEINDGQDILAIAQDGGLTIAAQFGVEPALVLLRTDGRHLQLGYGLLVIVLLQDRYSQEEAAERSARLNFDETIRWTDFPQFGSWHYKETDDGAANLAHTTFIPNVLARPGLAANFAHWSLARARWAQTLVELWTSPTLQ